MVFCDIYGYAKQKNSLYSRRTKGVERSNQTKQQKYKLAKGSKLLGFQLNWVQKHNGSQQQYHQDKHVIRNWINYVNNHDHLPNALKNINITNLALTIYPSHFINNTAIYCLIISKSGINITHFVSYYSEDNPPISHRLPTLYFLPSLYVLATTHHWKFQFVILTQCIASHFRFVFNS